MTDHQSGTTGRQSEPTLIEGHEYDGIMEYDNPTPLWWHLIFVGTVLFSVVYFFMSLGSPYFVHQIDRLEAAQVREFKILFAEIGELESDQDTILTMSADDKWMSVAATIFTGNCAACHKADGGGTVGPNLTDDHYKTVRQVTDLYQVITEGAAGGAMPAWENRLHKNERVLLAAYVASLRGTSPVGAKGPEGDPIESWPPVPPAADEQQTLAPAGGGGGTAEG